MDQLDYSYTNNCNNNIHINRYYCLQVINFIFRGNFYAMNLKLISLESAIFDDKPNYFDLLKKKKLFMIFYY